LEIKNCRRCGKVYIFNGSTICKDCMIGMDQYLDKIRDYLLRNPDSDIDTISNDTGIDTKIILQLLRDGRLQYKGRSRLTCRTCGETIDTGYYCEKCQQVLSYKIQGAAKCGITAESSKSYRTRYRKR
jgi:hypothetical protein